MEYIFQPQITNQLICNPGYVIVAENRLLQLNVVSQKQIVLTDVPAAKTTFTHSSGESGSKLNVRL